MDLNATTRGVVVTLVAFTGATIGCSGQPGRIVGAKATLPEKEGSPGYLDRISSQITVSENDALRGMLLLLDGTDDAADFQQRVQGLTARQTACEAWNYDANRPITKGKLAYMLYQACKIPGGLTLTLLGPSQRYCLRELQYLGMMSSGVTYTPVTGLEFVAALTRADTYLQTNEVPEIMKSDAE